MGPTLIHLDRTARRIPGKVVTDGHPHVNQTLTETSPRRAVIARRTIRCFKTGTHASHIRPIFGQY
jgi:hypothetical protein